MARAVIPNPPRLTGNPQDDFFAYVEWLESFYTSLALSGILAIVAGNFTISDTGTSADVVLPTTDVVQPDADYDVMCSVQSFAGSPPIGAHIVNSITNKTTTGFTVGTFDAPGGGNSVTFVYTIVRTN
jgi:hypothetical protein